jgi:RecB family exonuclease
LPRTLISSPSAAARISRAAQWLERRSRGEGLRVVGGSVDGALELVRRLGGASFGWHRTSLDHLALELATPALTRLQRAPASRLALEAIWSRVVHRLHADGRLGRFDAVADRPGLPRALERMMHEARLMGVPREALDGDLAAAAEAFEQALDAAALVDRAQLLTLATEAAAQSDPLPLLLLDVEVATLRELRLVEALAASAPEVLATAPAGDTRTLAALARALGIEPQPVAAGGNEGLARLQTHLFAQGDLPRSPASDALLVLSAPGEVRECVELARLIQREAEAGTPFDRMAVLLRAPGAYRSAITEALRRAGVPAYFARGSRLPDPSGRALLALLGCAEEGLSASRFAEYLSLGEVPRATPAGAPPPAPAAPDQWAAPEADEDENGEPEEPEVDPDAPVVAGTLRSVRHWEKLLVDASVIGGRDRWSRRLDALERDLVARRAAPDVPEWKAAELERSLSDLKAFRAFALPLLDALAPLTELHAPWREWIEALSSLATRALRRPDRALSLLAELSPMADVGPISLREVTRVLSERLLELTAPPRHARFGRVFVGPIDAARGLSFDVVFAPGLAERIFPQKVREDPIAPDHERARIGYGLTTTDDRVGAERLQLQLAVGAATRRVVLSFPRIDVHEGRPRVPSFYALEAVKAAEGELPGYEVLAQRAEGAVEARIGWPAPKDPRVAIDDAERDLAMLYPLFRDRSGEPLNGRARYLVQVNPHLSRALRLRWARWSPRWNAADGLVAPTPEALAALEAHRLENRPFSATALQHFASCPYRFFLSAVLRLSPREEPSSIEELDPLQRGSMVHEVQWGVLSALRDEGALPAKAEGRAHALELVDRVLDEVAGRHHELYHPAIERIWLDGIEAIRADVRKWMNDVVDGEKTPWKFELAFGLGYREQEDPDSRPDPVELDGGLKLRGSIDLVERTTGGSLWATDYKTGKRRAELGTVIGGGKTLQPVLYALALEKLFPGAKVEGGALWYCTQAGGFTRVPIPLTAAARAAAREAIQVVGQSIERGFLPAAPAADECDLCDYRGVCGAEEERRSARKPRADLAALQELRKQP